MKSVTGILESISGSTKVIVNPESLTVDSIGGKFQLSIESSTSWKILNIPEYITVSKIRGYGDDIIDVVFSVNNSTSNDRVGNIVIQNSVGNITNVSFTQNKAVIDWVYTFSVQQSVSFANTGETKSLDIASYKTPYLHGSVYGSNVNVDYSVNMNVDWCTINNGSIVATENPDTSSRSGIINYTQSESAKTATTSITQSASVWTWKYNLSVGSDSITVVAKGGSNPITVSAWRQKYLNGRATDTKVNIPFTFTSDLSFGTVDKVSAGLNVLITNNTTSNQRSGSVTITPTLSDVTQYPLEGSNVSKTIYITQEAGAKVYNEIIASLSYNSNASAAGGTCSPSLSYSQTYTWNGSGSEIEISSDSLTKSAYTLASTSGATINTSTGIVTWSNNTSASIRTSGNISITISGLDGKTKTITATCKQNAGVVEYKILGASITLVPKGESRSQDITYDTIWNGIKTSNDACSGYTITEASDSTSAFSASGTTGTVTISAGNNTTASARSASYTISKSGYTSGTISVSQSAGNVAYYINDVTVSAIAAAGGSTTANITYTTKWNDITTKTDSLLSGYIISETSDSTGRFSATGTSGVITISATNNTSTSVGNAQYTISKRGYNIGLVNVSQNAGSVRYLIDTVSTNSIPASGGSKTIDITYDTEWNGIITTNNTALPSPYTVTETSDSSGAFSATSSGSSVTITASENNSSSSRTAQYTISKSGYVDGKIIASQPSNSQSYSAWVVSISANNTSNIAATGGTSTITASASRTWGWNGATSGGGTETGTVTLSIPTSVTGASLSGSTLTWDENKTTSARSVTVRATCNEDTSKYKDITISQLAGYYTYGEITINSFAYGAISAVGGNVSPSITYSQPYGWNGATSGAGIINGNGDDDYTTYAETTTHSALTVNTTTGVVTWTKNNATAGSVNAARSGVITATVTRNGKTATKTATTIQNAEIISSYGDWSFSVVANTSSIAATGGSVTFTISRPTRTITYDTGDTQTQTATSGTFALTRSNSSFMLSTSSISMTSSSLPTFTLSVGATGAAAVAAISSTVTAAFTASNPTTGTTTKSVTSGSITRAESKHISTNYRINGFSVGTSSFNAAANSTTLSITTERQYVYTGNQNSNWSSFNPGSGLSVSCGTGGSAGAITYGNPSTCTISIAPNTGSARTISVSGSYSGGGSGSVTLSQGADEIISTAYSNVTAGSITNTTIPASGTTTNYTATAGNGSQVLTYSWRSGKDNTKETKTISPSHSSISATASSKGTTPSDVTTVKSQAVTWASLDGTSSKNATGAMYIYQAANVRSLSSVYILPYQPDSSWIITVSNGEWNTCPASGGYAKCYGYANYTHTSGSPLNDQYITNDAALTWSAGHGDWITNHSSGGYYINHRYTNEGEARSATATWTYQGKTSAGKTLKQQENYSSISSYGGWEAVTSWSAWSDYDYPYGDTTSDYWASCSIGNGITAGASSATVSKSAGHTIYHYKRQRRSATQYRDIHYVWTSGSTWTHDNGSSQTVYEYQKVSNGSTAASDDCTIAIVSNGNGRFSLSGTTLNHSTMGKNLVTDDCTVRCTNSANNSATKDASVSVTNSVGSYYDNGSWGSWSDTGSAYYVGSEWEGSSTDYWANCSIGSGITAGTSSASISASAGHTRNFYKSRNIATIRYMPTRRDYTSGDYDTSSRSETSARSYDSVWQRGEAASDTYTLSLTSNVGGRFSISGNILNHSTMGTTAAIDSCTIRCTNNAATSVYKEASVSDIGNSKSYTTYSNLTTTIGDIGANGSATAKPTTTYAYNYAWTSGSTGADWFTVTGRGNAGAEYVTYSVSGVSNGATLNNTSGSVKANSLGTTTKSRTKVATLNMTFDGWGGGQGTTHSVDVYQAANAVTNGAYNAYNSSYWANCSIGTGITAAGGSATVTKSAGHTYYYQQLYTSGSVAPTSSTYYSSAQTDNCTIAIVSNGNSRFSLSGTTLSHSTMGTSATTDTCTIRCTNSAYASATKDASVSATNSKGAGTYTFTNEGNRTVGYEAFDAQYHAVTSTYSGKYTSGSSYTDDVAWSVADISGNTGNWLLINSAAGDGLYLSGSANTSSSSRAVTIYLRQNTSYNSSSFKVTQEASPYTPMSICSENGGALFIYGNESGGCVDTIKESDIVIDVEGYMMDVVESSGYVGITISNCVALDYRTDNISPSVFIDAYSDGDQAYISITPNNMYSTFSGEASFDFEDINGNVGRITFNFLGDK